MSPSQFFDGSEILILARLCETIIPSEEGSSGAKDEGVHLFLEDYVAHAILGEQSLWKQGIRTLELHCAFLQGFLRAGRRKCA
jgi:Gluconate 2-dehydrogenase subunit 3